MTRTRMLAGLGALFYFAWGLLHLQSAIKVLQLGSAMPASPEHARVLQDGWNLLFFTAVVLLSALILNWRNSVLGYWISLTVVAAADIGFILFVLCPGYVPMWPGVLGPVLWILAWGFSTAGLASRRQMPGTS